MTHTTFVAFSSADKFVSDAIGQACKTASSPEALFIPWNRHDTSGQPIDRSVYSWVESADALVADISEPNHNVTYEVGLALGLRDHFASSERATKIASCSKKSGCFIISGMTTLTARSSSPPSYAGRTRLHRGHAPSEIPNNPFMSSSHLISTTSCGVHSATSKKSCGCAFAASIHKKSIV
jgi:hypothetical protein